MQHDNNQPAPAGDEPKRPSSEAEPAAATGAGFELGVEQLKAVIEALQTENDKLRAEMEAEKDQVLRLRAEMDNLRKRTEREKADTAKYAITKFAGDVVGVADNFERALQAVPADATADNPTLKALHEGVSMTEREFIKTLERHGVRRLQAMGEAFNPHQHQAVMEQEDASVASGTVVQVFQSGYVIEDRVLRPAMVVVSKGGPKARPAEPAATPNGNGPHQQAANDDRPAAEPQGTADQG